MPKLWKIKCRQLWKLLYRLHFFAVLKNMDNYEGWNHWEAKHGFIKYYSTFWSFRDKENDYDEKGSWRESKGYYKESKRCDKENYSGKINRKYSNSWFSPAAHSDEKIFRKEYRELAKRYHPDNNPKDICR